MIRTLYILNDAVDGVLQLVMPTSAKLGDAIHEVDLSVERTTHADAERIIVNAPEVQFHHVDGEVLVYVDEIKGNPLRVDRPGRVFICPDDGRIRADFLGGAARAAATDEAEVVFQAFPFASDAVVVAHQLREVGEAANAATSDSSSNGGVIETGYRAEWAQPVVLLYGDPSATVASRAAFGWLKHPPLPLGWMEDTGRDLTPFIGEVAALQIPAAVRINGGGGVTGETRAMVGLGRPDRIGSVGNFIGAAFLADPALGANWWASLSPYNDGVPQADPYYYRVDTGVPVVDYAVHVFEIRVGVDADGQPRLQWLIDGEVVGGYVGVLNPADGGGLASARDGRFGLPVVGNTALPLSAGYGIHRGIADGASRVWLAVGMGAGIKVIRGASFA